MSETRRIRTVLYNDERVEATELDLIHTPALQRLYELHQLGLTDRVFIDASHSRLHHVVGVLQQVENLTAAVQRNLRNSPERVLKYRAGDGTNIEKPAGQMAGYVGRRRRAVRLMGLLHDLTHSPYGHTLEDEIHLIRSKHDEPDRQADAFYRLLCQFIGWVARDIERIESRTDTTRWLLDTPRPDQALEQFLDAPHMPPPDPTEAFIAHLGSVAGSFLKEESTARAISREAGCRDLETFFRDLYFAMRGLLYLDVLHKSELAAKLIPRPTRYPFELVIVAVLEKAGRPIRPADHFLPHRDAFLLDIIGNTICADLLDYAKRDSHYTGLKLDYDEKRIIDNFTLVSNWHSGPASQPAHPFEGPSLRTAISIFSHRLRIEVPGELLNLLQIRFYVYQRVLFHPTKCIAGAMLGSALQLIGWKELPSHLSHIGDVLFLYQVGEAARLVRDFLTRYGTDPEVPASGISRTIFGLLDPLPPTGVVLAAKQLLTDRANMSIRELKEDLHAAIRLLDRLVSRRYYKPVFRLLPNVSIGSLNQSAHHIARVFLDPEKRRDTEREIEKEAELPRGSIVIHCPVGDGPKKISNILILSRRNGKEHKYPLREIAKIDSAIFQTHQEAVVAIEEMYASMWRLVVSVAPPYHQDYELINDVVGRVLYQVLSKGDTSDSVVNDPLMVRELEDASQRPRPAAASPVATVHLPSGKSLEVPLARIEELVYEVDDDRWGAAIVSPSPAVPDAPGGPPVVAPERQRPQKGRRTESARKDDSSS